MVKHEQQHDMEIKGDRPVSPDVAAGFGFPLNYEDREFVWEEVKGLHAKEWESLDMRARNALAAKQLVQIIEELKAMNGDVWNMANSAEKRMLFRARFFGRSGRAKLDAPPAKPAFPAYGDWTVQNESMLRGTTSAEKQQLYQRAAAKAAGK